MKHFTELIDLAAERAGGAVLLANDEFFAEKENLLKNSPPVFIHDKYTDRGKWMDGWETRRRRTPGHDWCVIKLGLPGVIRGALVDTSHFKGNYPTHCSIEACSGFAAPPESNDWIEVLTKSELKGDAENPFAMASPYRWTHLRFNIFPDGGVARLRVYGDPVPEWKELLSANSVFDLAAAANGGLVTESSDMFFGSRQNLIMPGAAAGMHDGWETRRRRGPGYDWAIIRLATSGFIRRVEIDTSHFKGNFPESCSLEGWFDNEWGEILGRVKLQADTRHIFETEIRSSEAVSQVRLNIFPDGGVARLRVFGLPSPNGLRSPGMAWLNTLPPQKAEGALLSCCGSQAWARGMAARRPFSEFASIVDAADEIGRELSHDDWLEAFRAHPRIGGQRHEAQVSAKSREWSEAEQAGVQLATPQQRAALEEANRAYEARFGHIFIVCASGKTTGEMLALIGERLQNDPVEELRVAIEEQGRITQLRLEKLIRP